MLQMEQNYTPEMVEFCYNITNTKNEPLQITNKLNNNAIKKILKYCVNIIRNTLGVLFFIITITFAATKLYSMIPFGLLTSALLFAPTANKLKVLLGNLKHKTLLIVILFITTVIIGGAFTSTENSDANISNNNSINKSSEAMSSKTVSEKELVTLANHPRIGDAFQTGLNFKQNVNDNRVKVLTSQEYGRLSWDTSSPNQNATLYLVEDPSGRNEIGEFEVNIKNENITLNDAIEIIKSYLPANFSTYYKKDSAFYREYSHATVYSYAVRLNNKGYQATSQNGKRLSAYLSFYVYQYKDGTWKICSD